MGKASRALASLLRALGLVAAAVSCTRVSASASGSKSVLSVQNVDDLQSALSSVSESHESSRIVIAESINASAITVPASNASVFPPVYVCGDIHIQGGSEDVQVDLQETGRFLTLLECPKPITKSVTIQRLTISNGGMSVQVFNDTIAAIAEIWNRPLGRDLSAYGQGEGWKLAYGGAIFVRGVTLTLTNVNFYSCKAVEGGSIYMVRSQSPIIPSQFILNAENCRFVGSQSIMNGGAIYATRIPSMLLNISSWCTGLIIADIGLKDCEFTNSMSSLDTIDSIPEVSTELKELVALVVMNSMGDSFGGGFSFSFFCPAESIDGSSRFSVDVQHCTFESCTAGSISKGKQSFSGGGGVHIKVAETLDSRVVIQSTSFVNCSSRGGESESAIVVSSPLSSIRPKLQMDGVSVATTESTAQKNGYRQCADVVIQAMTAEIGNCTFEHHKQDSESSALLSLNTVNATINYCMFNGESRLSDHGTEYISMINSGSIDYCPAEGVKQLSSTNSKFVVNAGQECSGDARHKKKELHAYQTSGIVIGFTVCAAVFILLLLAIARNHSFSIQIRMLFQTGRRYAAVPAEETYSELVETREQVYKKIVNNIRESDSVDWSEKRKEIVKYTNIAEVSLDDFDYGAIISRGSYMEIYKICMKDGVRATVTVPSDGNDPAALCRISLNAINLCAIRGPVVNIFGILKEKPGVVLEHLPGVILHRLVEERNSDLEEEVKLTIAKEVATELCWLHSINLVHLDITPHNIIAGDKEGYCYAKIVDYSSCQQSPVDPSSIACGQGLNEKSAYCAPEILNQGEEINEKVDIYSFGRLLEFVWEGRLCDEHGEDLSPLSESDLKPRPPISRKVADLVESCCRLAPAKRPSIETVKHRLDDIGSYFQEEIYCRTAPNDSTEDGTLLRHKADRAQRPTRPSKR